MMLPLMSSLSPLKLSMSKSEFVLEFVMELVLSLLLSFSGDETNSLR